MPTVFVLFVELKSLKNEGYLADDTNITTPGTFVVRYTRQVDFSDGTIATFSRRRMQDILNKVIKSIKIHRPEHAPDMMAEIREFEASHEDINFLMNKKYMFKCEKKK